MGKPRSNVLYKEDGIYHVYNRGHNKMRIFRTEDDYSKFVYLMYKYLKLYDIDMVCYCLLPNHFHMLLKLGEYKTHISKFFQCFMTAYCCYFNRKYRLVGSVFQGRFLARRIVSSRDYRSMINYIKENPKEANLTKEGEHYRWLFLRKGWNRLKV